MMAAAPAWTSRHFSSLRTRGSRPTSMSSLVSMRARRSRTSARSVIGLTLEDPRAILEPALAEIEQHDHAGPGRGLAGERVGRAAGDRAQHLVPQDDLAEVDHHDVAEQVLGLVPAADLRLAQF